MQPIGLALRESVLAGGELAIDTADDPSLLVLAEILRQHRYPCQMLGLSQRAGAVPTVFDLVCAAAGARCHDRHVVAELGDVGVEFRVFGLLRPVGRTHQPIRVDEDQFTGIPYVVVGRWLGRDRFERVENRGVGGGAVGDGHVEISPIDGVVGHRRCQLCCAAVLVVRA
ncbi:hypothetical protein ACW9HR_22280 [Nocardia gipuzkoensis]